MMKAIKNNNKFQTIHSTHKDGVDYINIIKPKTRLGVLLNPDYPCNVNTLVGDAVSIRRLMEYLNKAAYPTIYLTKPKLSKGDILTIKKLKSKHIEHYWVIILYILLTRVREDVELRKLLEENTLEFAAVTETIKTEPFFNTTMEVKTHVTKLAYYLSCIRIASFLVNKGSIDDSDYIKSILDGEVNGDFFKYVSTLEHEIRTT